MDSVLLAVILGIAVLVVVTAVVLDVRRRAAPAVVPRDDARSVGPRAVGLEDATWEARRQAAVDASGIVDTPRDDRYDHIVSLARQLYHADAALFTVIDHNREWHKAMVGTDVVDNDRETSFCSVTIRSEGAMVVGDARDDDRFVEQPAVIDDGVRFYAGYPVTVDGQNIGALCVYGSEPRVADGVDDSMLKNLAALIEAELRVDALQSRRP